MTTSRELIIKEIKRVAADEGRAPGIGIFTRATGIPEHHWKGVYWSKWSDALADAGLEANSLNERLDTEVLLRAVAGVCLSTGAMPSKTQYKLYRRSTPNLPHDETLRHHFGSWDGLRIALRDLGHADVVFADLLILVPESVAQKRANKSTAIQGWVYLLKSGAHFKIGRSDTIERRVREISIALPERVDLAHAIETDDPVGIEAYWHRRFSDRRMNGEWFNLTVDDVRAFRRRKFQ